MKGDGIGTGRGRQIVEDLCGFPLEMGSGRGARREAKREAERDRAEQGEERERGIACRDRKRELRRFEFLTTRTSRASDVGRNDARYGLVVRRASTTCERRAMAEEAFQEWKSLRRAELSEYQKQIEENYISNVDKELERWQNARNARRSNNLANLQESMDKELETHRLVHGPKTRRISGGNDEDDDVEDIVIEDELLDEVLEPHDRPEADATKIPEIGNGSSGPA